MQICAHMESGTAYTAFIRYAPYARAYGCLMARICSCQDSLHSDLGPDRTERPGRRDSDVTHACFPARSVIAMLVHELIGFDAISSVELHDLTRFILLARHLRPRLEWITASPISPPIDLGPNLSSFFSSSLLLPPEVVYSL